MITETMSLQCLPAGTRDRFDSLHMLRRAPGAKRQRRSGARTSAATSATFDQLHQLPLIVMSGHRNMLPHPVLLLKLHGVFFDADELSVIVTLVQRCQQPRVWPLQSRDPSAMLTWAASTTSWPTSESS